MKKIFYITIPVLLICIVFIYNISIKIPYNDPEKLFEYYKENKNIHQEKVINALANTRNKTYLEYLEKDYYNEINESEIIAGFVKNTMVFSDRERIFAKYLNENNNELSSMVSMIYKNELKQYLHNYFKEMLESTSIKDKINELTNVNIDNDNYIDNIKEICRLNKVIKDKEKIKTNENIQIEDIDKNLIKIANESKSNIYHIRVNECVEKFYIAKAVEFEELAYIIDESNGFYDIKINEFYRVFLRTLNKKKIFNINGQDKTLPGYALITLEKHQEIIKQGIQDYNNLKHEKDIKLADIDKITFELEEIITDRDNEIQKVISYIR